MSEATTLPTEPQPLPEYPFVFLSSFCTKKSSYFLCKLGSVAFLERELNDLFQNGVR